MKHALPALCLAASLTAAPAFAIPKFFRSFNTHYANAGIDVSDLASNESCGTCHVNPAGGGRRNAYGRDFDAAGAGEDAFAAIEAKETAESMWYDTCMEITNATLLPKSKSWILGANIPGKPISLNFYMGGYSKYKEVLQEVRSSDYADFSFQA